jgi:hypothetical protein
MAIKKCDDIVVEAEALETEGAEGTTEEGAGERDPLERTEQGLTGEETEADTTMGSTNLADQAQEILAQMTPEEAMEALQDEELQELQEDYKKKQSAYLGKTITAVESAIYDTTTTSLLNVSTFGNGNIKSTRPANISDPLRAEYRSFFTQDSNDQLSFFSSDNVDIYGSTPIKISPYQGSTPTSVSSDLFKKYQQSFIIESDNFIVNNDSDGTINLQPAWDSFMNGGTDSITGLIRPSAIIDTTQTFTDHYMKINSLFNDEDMERFSNAINNPAYGKVVPTYNFFIKGYENYIASANISEYQLQNQFSNITRENSELQAALHELGMDYRYVQNIIKLKDQQGYDITEKFQNIGIPKSSVPSIKEVTDTDDLYSLLNYIEFNTEATGQFLISAADTGMTDDLFKFLMDQNIVYPEDLTSAAQANRLKFAISTEIVTYNNTLTLINTDIVEENVAIVDLSSWLLSYLSKAGAPSINTKFSDVAVLLGVDPNKAETSEDCNAFLQTLKSLLLSGKLQQVVNDRFRTFEQMLAGEEAYNETIMYEIVRTGGDSAQRIFVPNVEDLDIMRYADTQVKYDRDYTYEIYAHQLIVGSSYKYYNFNVSTNSKLALFAVEYEPSLQIARLPIFNQTVRILDNAPVFPDVSIIPFKGVTDRILINLNGNMGKYELEPIIMSDADNEFISNYRDARGLSGADPILYESDDPVSEFEIYRSTNAPLSYADLGTQLLTTVSSDVATSVSFVDNVSPNTKYYYTFRSIDVHGNRSNPTDVYVIELVQFEGMIFFNQSIYEFGSEEYNNVKTEKTFKRYFQINPNLIQSLIDYEKTFPDGDTSSALKATSVSVGRADTPVWDKRFKLRITSKNSGKKFDINFTCKTQFIQNTDDTPPIDPGVVTAIAKTGFGQLSSAVQNTTELTQEGVQLDFEAPSNNTQEDAQEAIEESRQAGTDQPEAMAPDNDGDPSSTGSKSGSKY